MAKCEFWRTWQGKDPRDNNTESCLVEKANTGCRGEIYNCRVSIEAIAKYVHFVTPKPITPKPYWNRLITPTHFP